MGELARDQERHGDEVTGRAIAARLGLSRLQQRVDRLYIARVQVGSIKRFEYSHPMLLNRLGQVLEGLQAASLRPVQPPLESLPTTGCISVRIPVDIAQRLLQSPRPGGLQAGVG